jgi:GPI ethanolamine phosphate transferase 3 subunit O
MDDGDPLPSFEGLAAAFAKAKAQKEREEASGLRPRTGNAAAANKRGEVHFKALHLIVIAFFAFILYLSPDHEPT